MAYYRIRNVKVQDMGPTDDYYVIQTTPGRTNMSHEERVEGWLGQTNDWSAYAEGEFDSIEAAAADIDLDIYERRHDDAALGDWPGGDNIVAVYRDKRAVWSVDDWLIDPIKPERDGFTGMTPEQIAEALEGEAAEQDIVLTGDVAERVRELMRRA